MRIVQYIILLGMLALGACTQEAEVSEKSVLQIRIGVSDDIQVEQTRSAQGDGNVMDGGGMEDLVIILVSPKNKVVSKKSFTYNNATGWSGDDLISNTENKEVTTRFTDLDVSDYKVYAYANTVNCPTYFNDELRNKLNNVTVGSDFELADAVLPALTGTNVPEVSATRPMLLTAAKEIPVQIGVTEAVVEMLRPFVSFELQVHNHSSKTLKINSLNFRSFNPTTAYLTPHAGVLPEETGTGNVYRSLPAFSTPIEITTNDVASVYKTYLYETTAEDSRYQFDLNLGFEGVTVETSSPVLHSTTPRTEVTGQFQINTIYALFNTSKKVYLMDDGTGKMTVASQITNENFLNASWEFSGSSEGYLKNSGTNKLYYRSTQSQIVGNNLTFNGTNVLYIYYPYIYYDDYGYKHTEYYCLHYDSEPEYRYNGSTLYGSQPWKLYTINTEMKTTTVVVPPATASNQQISVIQGDGTAIPMTEMRRNQKVVIVVNVYFEEQTGTFRFYLKPWDSKSMDVTFN